MTLTFRFVWASIFAMSLGVMGCDASRDDLDIGSVDGVKNRILSGHSYVKRMISAKYEGRRYCALGSNSWMSVEYYPDGLVCRISKGTGADGPNGSLVEVEREFDFCGREICPAADPQEVSGNGSYVHCLSRVHCGASVLSERMCFDMYYYVADQVVKACAWIFDRRSGRMDKILFTINMPQKGVVSVSDVEESAHSVIAIRRVYVQDDGHIGVEFTTDVLHEEVLVGIINPTAGMQRRK